ncbi:hypothetical protein ACIQU6_41650 [Streptomyces sp. NPDC090442]|uniref:hypothetical protein n=1 Tax=Streptomyces sp. NPDC090442 TaxID=3365962 RepID=UPI0038266F7E
MTRIAFQLRRWRRRRRSAAAVSTRTPLPMPGRETAVPDASFQAWLGELGVQGRLHSRIDGVR